LNYTRRPGPSCRMDADRQTATCPDMVPDPCTAGRRRPGPTTGLARRAPHLGRETVSCQRAAL